jgi:hypothetical protein
VNPEDARELPAKVPVAQAPVSRAQTLDGSVSALHRPVVLDQPTAAWAHAARPALSPPRKPASRNNPIPIPGREAGTFRTPHQAAPCLLKSAPARENLPLRPLRLSRIWHLLPGRLSRAARPPPQQIGEFRARRPPGEGKARRPAPANRMVG